MPARKPDTSQESTYSPRAVLLALVLLAILVGGGLYLVYRLRASADMQDCVMQGRSNCAAVDPR
jgi:hypothetical protein